MKLIILVTCLVALAAARQHRRQTHPFEELMNSVPECAAAKAAGTAVPNCPDLGPCLDTAHTAMKECHTTLNQDEKFKTCAQKQQDDLKSTLKDGCRWTTAVRACMQGGQAPGSEWDDVVNAAPAAPHAPGEHHQWSDDVKTHMKCMHEAYGKLKQCHETGSACPNMKICAGKETPPDTGDDNLKKWHKITNHLKHEKKTDMKKYWEDMKTCLTAA